MAETLIARVPVTEMAAVPAGAGSLCEFNGDAGARGEMLLDLAGEALVIVTPSGRVPSIGAQQLFRSACLAELPGEPS